MQEKLGRRSFLRTSVGTAASVALASSFDGWLGPAHAHAQECGLTDSNLEGPFYRSGAPLRSVLASGLPGVPLVVRGHVLAGCRAAPAELDVWQANTTGDYDNAGFTLRGRMRTDDDGAFRFETIVPGHYLNGPQYRPAHIHVKVRTPGRPELTTQLYFQGDPYNAIDPWYLPSLELRPRERSHGLHATFDFSV